MIYADYNASTPLCPSAVNQMHLALEYWGNPNSAHQVGRKALELLEKARGQVAERVGVKPSEIVFTSGGSEANTTALLGCFFNSPGPFRLLTSAVEHSSINGTIKLLEERGSIVEYVRMLPSGEFDLEHLAQLIKEFRPNLVSLMAANNETGVVFPTPEIVSLCRARGVTLHTDAVQAFGKVSPTHWNDSDLISISSHKIYGPKGVGALIVRRGASLCATHFGGSQETKRRGGTQNMVGIAGFGGACSELGGEDFFEKIRTLRDRLEKKITEACSDVHVLGSSAKQRTPNTSNFRFEGVTSEVLLGALDLDGVCVSAGSACASGSIIPSHVLTAIGLTPEQARECIRVSWGKPSTLEDVDSVAEAMLKHVQRIRERRHHKAK